MKGQPAAIGASGRVRKARNASRSNNVTAFFSVLPMIVLILAVTIYPTLNALFHSFTQWDGLRSSFIGLENYWQIIIDPQFWRLLLNNLIYIASVPLQILIALVITVLLYEQVAGWGFFRALFFLPNVLSPIIIGLIFRQAFMWQGPINAFFHSIHLDGLALDWLAKGPTAMGVILLTIVWTNFGYGVILFLAGSATIETSVFEAALLDGANWFQKTFRIVLPLLGRVIEFFTVTTVIWMFTGLFGFIFAITKGGPGYDTTPLEYMVYLKAFKSGGKMGYACALAVILFLITFGISRLNMAITERSDR
jgi:ABC-type sugar transport system permease subunit